jgi:hypothetical protein
MRCEISPLAEADLREIGDYRKGQSTEGRELH